MERMPIAIIGCGGMGRRHLTGLGCGSPGETLPGLEAVLGELTNMSALDKAHFMTSPDARLDGQTPLDVLRRGDIARVRGGAHVRHPGSSLTPRCRVLIYATG